MTTGSVRLGAVIVLALARGAALHAQAAVDARTAPDPVLPVVTSLYVLDVPFLHLGSPDFSPIDSGQVRLEARLEYGNTFSHTWHAQKEHESRGIAFGPFTREEAEDMHRTFPGETIEFLDAEVTRVSLDARVGLSRGFAASVNIPFISWSALDLDEGVQSFHHLLGFPDAQRPGFPRGRFQLVLQRPYGALEYDDATPRAGLGDVRAALEYRKDVSASTTVAVDVDLKAPTGSPGDYRGSGSFDGGFLLGLLCRTRNDRLRLHADFGVVVPGAFRARRDVTIDPSPFYRALLGAEVRVGARTCVSFWADVEQSPQHRLVFGDVARPAVEAGIGVARRVPGIGTLALSVVENVPRFGDAADVTVSLRIAPSF